MELNRTQAALWVAGVVLVGAVLFLVLRAESGSEPTEFATPAGSVTGSGPEADAAADGTAPTGDGSAAAAPDTTRPDGQEPDDTSLNTAVTSPVDENGCAVGYAGACLPLPPPVLTCADIPERGILVTGPDVHNLDPDADGEACPSELPPATQDPNVPPDPLD